MVRFLQARDYLESLLISAHKVPAAEVKGRAASIIPHVRLAVSYIAQSQAGPAQISFLPAYYAILNLMKVYILLGPDHALLPKNRWHGATYDVGETHQQIRPVLLYRFGPKTIATAICTRGLYLTEEFSTAVLFFYMSSIVRYRPEFFSKLQDSKFWSYLATARTHAFHFFLLAFWSFMQQKSTFFDSTPE